MNQTTSPRSSGKSDAAQVASEEAGKARDSVQQEARDVADSARQAGREHAEAHYARGKSAVGEELDAVSDALDQAADSLDDERLPLASYTKDMAEQLSGLSNRLQGSSLDDLARETRRFARENPSSFLLGSVAVGIAASRFFKASSRRSELERHAHSSPYSGSGAAEGSTPASDSYGSSGHGMPTDGPSDSHGSGSTAAVGDAREAKVTATARGLQEEQR